MSTVSNAAQSAADPEVFHNELRTDSIRETSLSGSVPVTEQVGPSFEVEQDSDAPSVNLSSGLQPSEPGSSIRSRITFDGELAFILHPSTSSYFDQLRPSWKHIDQSYKLLIHDVLEYLSLSEITFEWGDSYDDKDWSRLRAILAPTLMVGLIDLFIALLLALGPACVWQNSDVLITLQIDYSEVNGHKWDSMPANDFVDIMSHVGFVGDPLVHTQHHIGASKWRKIADDYVIGHHQLRAAHQRYTSLDLKVVENKGHGHALVQHHYRKVHGEWKLAGLRPTVRWNEYEFDKIFRNI